MDIIEITKELNTHGQDKVAERLVALPENQQEKLVRQIEAIDWNVVESIHNAKNERAAEKHVEPLNAVEIKDIKENKEKYMSAGLDAIKNGKVAAVLLAGGQGTRLGLDKPKGTLNVGIHKELFLFEQLINNIMDVVKLADAWVPLYIMTSEKNNNDTITFFEEHNYFGYDKNYVQFFIQNMVPSVDYNGKLYMEAEDSLSMSPNGNGGWFLSMIYAGLDKDLRERRIEWVNVFAVDNILQRIADPGFVGATILSGCECGSKVVRKVSPDEKVGVMCRVNGHPSIIEYYEMPEELATKRREDGELEYGFGVILNYLFSLNKLFEIADRNLPLHIVEKKIPYINDDNELVKPDQPNGYKFETLVLDMVEMMDDCIPYEVERDHEFAPIKNKTGMDSLESARELLKVNGIEF
ncbi:MAG: UDPGP type 1 family protein [Eubacteriales bacterium]|nr:UDPGP type 1 family protein [Eubacteriales bacterium]